MATAVAASKPRSRVRNPDDSTAVGLRVSHLLGSVDLESSGLPPAATLIVRRFPDPMPKGLQSDPSALIPSSAWERAARAELSAFGRRAARPALGSVTSSADAVWFADEGELLACLARDLLRGAAASLWWWRATLRNLSSSTQPGLVEAWRRDARYVPAALAHLAARGEAEWILNAFSPAQAWTILEDVTRAFEIESVCAVSQPPSSSLNWSSSQSISATSNAGPIGAEDVVSAATSLDALPAVAPPWRGVLANDLVPARLGRERMALLGVSLVLSRAPGIARSRRFTETFSRWYQSARTETVRQVETRRSVEPDATGSNSDVSATQPTEPRLMNAIDLLGDPRLRAEHDDAEAQASQKGPEEHALAIGRSAEGLRADGINAPAALNRPGPEAAEEVRTGQEASEKKALQPGPGLNPEIETIARSEQASQAVSASATVEALSSTEQVLQASEPSPPVVPPMDASEGLATELGGVLFLVNVLKALRLPDSLEDACGTQLGLGSWELIELIARCLLGPGHIRLSSDPIWTVLATLDGRLPEQNAGAHFVPSTCYRLPADWIPAAESSCSTSHLAIRLRGSHFEIWHRLGFPCVIRQFDRPPSRSQIEREIREVETSFGPAARSFLRRSPRLWAVGRLLGFAPDRTLRRFLSFLLPFVRWRLAAAVGLQATQSPIHADALLLRTGRLWLTSTHVDLVMDLRQATGPVRLAGLDADPGWVPELGRVVKFHFR